MHARKPRHEKEKAWEETLEMRVSGGKDATARGKVPLEKKEEAGEAACPDRASQKLSEVKLICQIKHVCQKP